MKHALSILLLCLAPLSVARADIPQLLQLIDYVGVDYAGAVADGRVINPAEYDEMREFTAGIREMTAGLPTTAEQAQLQQQADTLAGLVSQHRDASQIQTLTADMRLALISAYPIQVVPREAPDLSRAQALFSENCGACHGASGLGDGPLAATLSPPPTNFQDRERYAQRTLYGLYSTITQGVPDTAMQAYAKLSDQERWSLAFYIGSLAPAVALREQGAALFAAADAQTPLSNLKTLTLTTPAQAAGLHGDDGAALMAYLRSAPAALFERDQPLDFARQTLQQALTAYRRGDAEAAYQLTIKAYLDGFELVEQGLNAIDSPLRIEIEQAMTGLRNDLRKQLPAADIAQRIAAIDTLLATAGERLAERSLSGGAAFGGAFFILVREGLEALLVVAALAAFLVKTGRRDAMRYLHIGWLGALAAGLLTWLASRTLIEVSGASREITEGVAALSAAVILFYVGFWLHDKTHAVQWRRFIEDNIRKSLSAGTLWGLAGLSFVAVYREVFESILFYEALFVQTNSDGKTMAIAGLGLGAVVLAVLAWLVIRYSVRLPLRQFFAATGLLMFMLAIVFAGKGVAALQEAGYLPITPLNLPRIDLLGIYPNMQGLVTQVVLLLAALLLWYGMPGRRQQRSEAR